MAQAKRAKMTMVHPSLCSCCVLAGIVLASGCGAKLQTYPVAGSVRFSDGKPLPGAIVSFRSVDGGKPTTARGRTDSDGRFRLTTIKSDDGAVLGKHQVLVAVPVVESDGPFARPRLDHRFSDYSTSGLEFSVSEDPEQNRFEIVVTAPKK